MAESSRPKRCIQGPQGTCGLEIAGIVQPVSDVELAGGRVDDPCPLSAFRRCRPSSTVKLVFQTSIICVSSASLFPPILLSLSTRRAVCLTADSVALRIFEGIEFPYSLDSSAA